MRKRKFNRNKKKRVIKESISYLINYSFFSIESKLWYLHQKFPDNKFYSSLKKVKKLSENQSKCIIKDFKKYKPVDKKENLFKLHKNTDNIENIKLHKKITSNILI